MNDKLITQNRQTITLYDAGGWFLVSLVFGLPFILGSILDYFWNYLVLHFTLSRLKLGKWVATDDSLSDRYTTKKRQFICTVFITVIGLIIDFVYYNIGWGMIVDAAYLFRVDPIFPASGADKMLELVSILAPMAAIGLANFILTRFYFHLKTKQAAILGAAMGFFTAPWLIIAIVLCRR